MQKILDQVYFHNTVQDYLIAFAIIVIGITLIRTFKRVVLQRFKKWSENTKTHVDDYVISGIERFGLPVLYYAIIYIALNYLTLSGRAEYIIKIATTVAITIMVVRAVSTTILLILKAFIRRQEQGEEKVKQLGGLMLLINIVIWVMGFLFLFDNMGYNITAIITGLGIGGIAIALAAQNILGDLFNYFVIFFDRPFEIGDFVTIDDKSGVVDYIGIKTTRIKSISGEQLVFSNSDLTGSRIHNYKRMMRRRILFKFGVIYQTPIGQLKQIPQMVKTIIEEQEPVIFDRSHFASYGDSSLDFETVYHILDNDYAKYMDVQQNINFRIFEEFQKAGIEFAYPTQTLFLNNETAGS